MTQRMDLKNETAEFWSLADFSCYETIDKLHCALRSITFVSQYK